MLKKRYDCGYVILLLCLSYFFCYNISIYEIIFNDCLNIFKLVLIYFFGYVYLYIIM